MKSAVLDFSKCKCIHDLHMQIRQCMADYKVEGFPDFYGNNADAFWDILTGFIETPIKFIVIPYTGNNKYVDEKYKLLIKILDRAKEYEVYFEIKS